MALWTPAEITTTLWLKANDASTLTLDTDNDVIQWRDKSGNGYHANVENTYRPQLLSSDLNGKDVIKFSVAGDHFELTSSGGGAIARNTDALSVFIVGKRTGGATFGAMFVTSVPISATTVLNQTGFYTNSYVMTSGRPVSSFSEKMAYISGAPSGYSQFVGLADYSGNTNKMRLNGSAANLTSATWSAGSSTADADSLATCIGSHPGTSNNFLGQIAEIIVVRSILGSTDLEKIEGYLAWEWGINGLLPSGHTYYSAAPEADDVVSVTIDTEISGILPTVESVLGDPVAPFMFLVQSEALDGNVDFVDSGTEKLSVLVHGDVIHSTNVAKFGNSSIKLTDTGGYLLSQVSDFFWIDARDFTVDLWFRQSDVRGGDKIWSFIDSTGSGGVGPALEIAEVDNYYNISYSNGTDRINYFPASYLPFLHIAVERKDKWVTLYVGGIARGTIYDDRVFDVDQFELGDGGGLFYAEEVRYCSWAVWDGDFTPPTAPYEIDWIFSGNFRPRVSAVSSVVENYATFPTRTFSQCKPWIVQPWNDSQGNTFGTVTTHGLLPETRYSAAVFATNNKVLIVGGVGPDGISSDRPNMIADINEDGTIGDWSFDYSVNTSLTNARVIETLNRIHLIGGAIGGSATSSTQYFTIYEDGSIAGIYSGPAMNEPRRGPAVVVTKNRVYAIGGYNLGAFDTGAPVKSTEYAHINLDGSLGPWIVGPNMPQAIDAARAIYTGSKVYVFGAYLSQTNYVMSADVSAEGVISNWVLESVPAINCTNPFFVQTKDYLFLVSSGSTYGTPDYTYVYPILSDGTINFSGVTSATRVDGLAYVNSFFITNSRLYSVGGLEPRFYQDGNTTYILDPEPMATVKSVPFSGGYNEYFHPDIISTGESTAIPVDGRIIAPSPTIHSYFGEWNFLQGDIKSPAPEISSTLIYSEFINASFISPVPALSSNFAELINGYFVAPLPDLNIYATNSLAEAISVEIVPPLPKISSYLDAQPFSIGRLKGKLPVVESVMSCPIVVWGRMKPNHPHINSSFQAIVDIRGYKPTISSILSNPIVDNADFKAITPAIHSTMMNPEIINGRFSPKAPEVNSFVGNLIAINGRVFTLAPKIKSFVQLHAIANGRLDSPLPEINSTTINQEVIRSSFVAKAPRIGSFINLSPLINGRIVGKIPAIQSALNNDIHVNVDYNCSVPVVHGEFFLPEDYDLIEYKRNRQCPLI